MNFAHRTLSPGSLNVIESQECLIVTLTDKRTITIFRVSLENMVGFPKDSSC